MYYRSCDSSQQLCKGLDLIPSASRGCPRGQTGPQISSESERPGSRMGFWALPFKACHPGWLAGCKCELPVISPWFPRKSRCKSHRPPGGAAPCLVTCPSHAERVFHWRITAVSTPGSLAGWLLCVMEGERWKNQAASGGFVGKGKKIFFFLSTHLRFSGWRQIDKRRIGNSLVVQWLGLYTFTAEGVGSIPTLGTKIPQAMQCSQITIIIVK